ncbi:hypothetical protein RND81_06G006300 [Saponaria officinalis]|uniref:Uncharacterized protein n=1 Tax=Saponaria officinalis TaxID=3572 RepID=A0AAW1K5G5_SAPOF
MTCSVCKSKTHNKRKCPDKGKPLPTPPPKRGRGRPKAAHNLSAVESVGATDSVAATETHHEVTAQPTRVGRGGRAISSGRGSRGGRRGKSTAQRGGRTPQGFGVLYDNQGTPFTNVPVNSNVNKILVHQDATTSCPSTQASVKKNP